MRDVALFVEDEAHRIVVGGIVKRLAAERKAKVRIHFRSATHGRGRVVREFGAYLRDLRRETEGLPDLIVVATDANCKGLSERIRELRPPSSPAPIAFAIPDPHIERWLLLDGAAFKEVFGRGCQAPDRKCARDRYKELLIRAIRNAGIRPGLGGIEFADAITERMDLTRAARDDLSFGRLVEDLSRVFGSWGP